MKTIEIRKASAPLSNYAANARNGPLVVTSKGKPVCALISLKGLDFETVRLSGNSEFMKIIDGSRRSIKREGVISASELRRRLKMKAQ